MFCKYRSETSDDIEASPILWKRDKFDVINKGYFWLSDTPDTESKGWDEIYDCFRMCVYVILREKKRNKIFNRLYGISKYNAAIKNSNGKGPKCKRRWVI